MTLGNGSRGDINLPIMVNKARGHVTGISRSFLCGFGSQKPVIKYQFRGILLRTVYLEAMLLLHVVIRNRLPLDYLVTYLSRDHHSSYAILSLLQYCEVGCSRNALIDFLVD